MRAATQPEAEVAATDSAAISIKTLKCKWSKCCNKVQALLHTHSFTHTQTHTLTHNSLTGSESGATALQHVAKFEVH